MKKLVVHVLSDAVSLGHLERPVYAQPHLGQQPMTDPPGPDLGDGDHASHCPHDCRDLLDDGRVDRIEQALPDTPYRLIADNHDGPGDDEAHHGVYPLCTQCDGNGTDEHQEGGDPVSAGMDAVGLQCGWV